MRLIDADKLILYLNDYALQASPFRGERAEAYNAIKQCIEAVEEQPTAYDIDKVVEELEEMIHPKQLYFCKYAKGGCKHLDNNDMDCMECVVENAIEIVKQGGVSDDVCEWHKVKNGNAYKCNTHAEIHDSRVLDWCKCPYRGEKIKVVEQNDN